MKRTNQRGEADWLLILVALVAFAFLLAIIISGSHLTVKRLAKASVHKLPPVCNGKSCKGTYQVTKEDKVWCYDFDFISDSGPTTDTSAYARFGNSLPPGGKWTQSTVQARAEEDDEEQVAEEETETDTDFNIEIAESEDGTPSSDAADSSTDGGAGDSGGGDSGGGDGGGGDGGGGD